MGWPWWVIECAKKEIVRDNRYCAAFISNGGKINSREYSRKGWSQIFSSKSKKPFYDLSKKTISAEFNVFPSRDGVCGWEANS
jgi:hypothetical protein